MTRTEWLRGHLPGRLYRHVLHFEAMIDREMRDLAAKLPEAALVLDAGAGEGQYAPHFSRQRYLGVDLGIGDEAWNYRNLDVLANLEQLPFRDGTFAAALNVVTLEHVKNPKQVVRELFRVLASGGELLLVAPQEWEVHQAPHDYWRYTRYGLRLLLENAGFHVVHVHPAGGFFRVLSRRVLYALTFFRWPWKLLAALLALPVGLALPWLDGLDRGKDFTLGYTCIARKPSHRS